MTPRRTRAELQEALDARNAQIEAGFEDAKERLARELAGIAELQEEVRKRQLNGLRLEGEVEAYRDLMRDVG